MAFVAKIVGAATEQAWSQVHTFFPKERDGNELALVAAVAVEVKPDLAVAEGARLDIAAFGAEVLQRLHEEYFGAAEGERGTLGRVKEALGRVEREFQKVKLAAAVGVIAFEQKSGKQVLYAAAAGEAKVELWREGKRLALLRGDGIVRGVSGYLRKGDRLILGTTELFSRLSEAQWDEVLRFSTAAEVADQVAPVVHSGESALSAGVVMDVEEVEVPRKASPRGEQNVPFDSFGSAQDKSAQGRQEVGVGEERDAAMGKIAVRLGANDWGKPWRSGRQVVAGFLASFWQRWLGRRQGRETPEGLYVGQSPQEKRRKLIGTVVILLLVLLGVSVVFGWVRQRTSMERRIYEETKAIVVQKMVESQALSELNPLRSRALLVEAVETVRKLRESRALSKQAAAWVQETETQLTQSLNTLMRIYAAQPEVFLDLGLVREGSKGEVMDFDSEELLVLDEGAQVALAVEVATKQAGVVGGGELLQGVRLVAVYFGRGFVVADTGVVELDIERKTSARVVEEEDLPADVGAIDVFGGNLYVLDKGGAIYRYPAREGGFGARQEWLGQGVEPDFSRVVAMAIDGKIWILTETGKVEVYAQGTGVAVELLGLDTSLNDPRGLYTDDTLERVYILDNGNKRVVVVDKEGQYVAQYVSDSIAEATDMAVSEEEGLIYLLSGTRIYSIKLEP
ncbi:MAG: hypothetical protein HYS86_03740 [Candidatus Chisholmbacteria bacterium]|nr:hypothetical protein [Candidatus Chisholmbacteria bacterium]